MTEYTEFQNLTDNEEPLATTDQYPARPGHLPMQNSADNRGIIRTTEGTPLKTDKVLLENQYDGLRSIIIFFVVVSSAVTLALIIQLAIGKTQIVPHGGISTCSQICSDMGKKILEKGGSAVDAAITGMLCVGIVHPEFAGIGGGGFMLIHDHKKHEATLFDFRETSPSKFTEKIFADGNFEEKRGIFIGVPGELRGMAEAHQRFGKLSWKNLLDPVVELAAKGFPVPESFVESLNHRRILDPSPEVSNFWAEFEKNFNGGKPIHPGSEIRRPDLAKTLQKIRDQGVPAFYEGEIAEEIVKTAQKFGSPIILEDLKNFRVEERKNLTSTFFGFEVETFPAPGSGALLLLTLNLLEQMGIQPGMNEAKFVEALADAIIAAAPNHDKLGDPDLEASDQRPRIQDSERAMISKDFAKNLLSKINSTISGAGGGNMAPSVNDFGTSHISVVDADDLFVSVTHTLNYWFGSLIQTPTYGILLNNQLLDFDPNSNLNKPEPNKKPLSSMAPTMIYNKERACLRRMAVGGTNGTRIWSGISNVIARVFGLDQHLRDAIDAPRVFCTRDGKCEMEDFDEQLVNAVKQFDGLHGHTFVPVKSINVVEAVMKNNDTVVAVADERNGGGGAASF